MKIRFLTALFIFIICNTLYAIEMDKIVAYPVPFNPKKHQRITIGEPSVILSGYNIKIEIIAVLMQKIQTYGSRLTDREATSDALHKSAGSYTNCTRE